MDTIDTTITKEYWTTEHYKLYETIPQEIREIAGDLFEIKWYGHANDSGLRWELEHNLLGTKEKANAFMDKYQKLTKEQKNLIYFAYDA